MAHLERLCFLKSKFPLKGKLLIPFWLFASRYFSGVTEKLQAWDLQL